MIKHLPLESLHIPWPFNSYSILLSISNSWERENLIGLTLLVESGHIKDPGYTNQVCTHIPITYGLKSLGYKTWLSVFIPLRGDMGEERRMWLVGLNDIYSLRKFMEGILQQWQTLYHSQESILVMWMPDAGMVGRDLVAVSGQWRRDGIGEVELWFPLHQDPYLKLYNIKEKKEADVDPGHRV